MNRLYYIWTAGHSGATGEGPSGPLRHGPVLASSEDEALSLIEPKLTSWDGPVKHTTTDEDYAPRMRYDW